MDDMDQAYHSDSAVQRSCDRLARALDDFIEENFIRSRVSDQVLQDARVLRAQVADISTHIVAVWD